MFYFFNWLYLFHSLFDKIFFTPAIIFSSVTPLKLLNCLSLFCLLWEKKPVLIWHFCEGYWYLFFYFFIETFACLFILLLLSIFSCIFCYCNCNIVNSLHLSIKDLYRGTKNTVTSFSLCSRSKDVVEPMMRPQWFVSCNSMAKVALDAVKSKKIEIIPPQYEQDWYR
jgi:hypothetical protein